jgi:hypothetical protein
MYILKIIASLVPAQRSDFFYEDGSLKESGTVFEGSPKRSFCGPRFIEYLYLDEILTFIDQDFYYVIKQGVVEHPLEYKFEFRLRMAVADDFRWSPNFPRHQRMYYTTQDKIKIFGPYFYNPDADTEVFQKQLAGGSILVPNEQQTFKPYIQNRMAS